MGDRLMFMDVFDFLRVVIGSVTAELIFVERTAKHRENFILRILKGCCIWLFLGVVYVGILYLQETSRMGNMGNMIAIASVWWLLVSIVTLCFIYYCYEITPCNLMFQCLFGLALERFITTILQYLICKKWFPFLQQEHTGVYIMLTIAIYGLLEFLAYLILVRWVPQKTSVIVGEDKKTFMALTIVFLFLSVMANVTNLIFEWSDNEGMMNASQEILNHYAIPYYCIVVNLIISLVIILLQTLIFRMIFLQEEKRLLLVLQKEKEQQYRFSKENVDLINQKCHDLKRQIRALKIVNGEERERLFTETEKAIQFYDAKINTGNDVLDTLLTEKSFLCTGQGIRFGCNIQANHLDFIDMIDLYTMLSNALDNAIECVSVYRDTEKRIVNVAVLERGNMLHLFVDNYFEGELEMKGGYPITNKNDKDYHGYGVKSMHLLAKKYDGDIRISVQNHTFSLQIMLPFE